MTFTDDFVTKLIHREIHKRQKKKINTDEDIITPNVLNVLEDNKVNTSLLKMCIKKKKKKILSKTVTQISYKEKNKHKLSQEYFENNIPLVYMGEKIVVCKCNVCEKSFKHRSALKKHEEKAHNLRKDELITITNTFNISEHDEEPVSLLKSQIKKKKKKNKKGSKMVLHKNIKKYKLNTEDEKSSQEYSEDDIIYTDKINNSKVYEKSFKRRSALKKHEAKAHNLKKDKLITTTNTFNISENDEEHVSLLKSQIKKLKKKNKKASKVVLHKNIKKYELNTEHEKRSQEYFEDDIIYMDKINNSEVYKCNTCELFFKHGSALKKHEAKAHSFNKGTPIITPVIADSDEAYTSLLKAQLKKMKKKKKKAYKAMTAELMQSNEIVKHEQKIQCVVLPKEYSDYDLNSRNTEETYRIKIYKCDICEKSFEQNSALIKHKKKAHILNKDITNTTIGIAQISEKEDKYTLLLRTLIKDPKNNKNNLIKSQEKTTVINNCDEHKRYMESNPTGYTKGMNIYKCNVCEKTFDIISDLSEQKTTLNIKCKICSKSFSSRFALSRHCKLHTGERFYKCDICDETFIEKKTLIVHYRSHTDKNPYTCEVCSKTFAHKSVFTAHYRSHTGVRPYTCDVCSKTYIHKSNLNVHYRLHTGERPYTCDVCSKTFTYKSVFIVHYRFHTGVKPYTCDVCSKSYAHKSNLSVHYRLHTGERPYTCDVCSRTFAYKSVLTIHYRSHTGERPYTCDICSKTFAHNSVFTIHYRSHTGERPYTCDVCSKTFAQKSNLILHCKSHTGKRPYTCDVKRLHENFI